MSTNYKKCELGNDLQFSDELINEMLSILVDEASDDFWKILKYGEIDALTNPSNTISLQDKYDMIKQNNINADGDELTRIKVTKFNSDISTTAHSEIRLFDGAWNIRSQNVYDIALGVEIISNNKIIALKDIGKTTLNLLRHEIYRIFNNAYVYKGIGRMSNNGTRGNIVTFNSDYQGYQFTLMATSG